MQRKLSGFAWALGLLAVFASGCAAETDDEEDAVDSTADELRTGVNSAGCKRSAYNCKLHPETKGQRVPAADGSLEWAMSPDWLKGHGFVDAKTNDPVVPVLDGNGDEMGRTRQMHFVFNYGQTRRIGNMTYALTLSSGLKSAGWVPIDGLVHAASFREKVGEVNARGKSLRKLACYHVKDSYAPRLDTFKVVKGSTDKDSAEPNDYLPVVRANGRRYMNLAFSVPGDALGAPSVDIFPAGTKFQRLDVPTWEKPDRPSLGATLYAKPAGSDTYTKPAGEMKFVYGYVKSKTGSVRYGWMALDGLEPSGGCPND